MNNKIRIFQADDNDQLKNKINKFHNVIDALLVFLNIDKNKFKEQLSQTIKRFNYKTALEEINKYIEFKTSSDILESDADLEKVIDRLKNEKFDIYIIDLKWGKDNDGGLKLLDVIKYDVKPENIIIYSQHDKIKIKNFHNNNYDYKNRHISTEDIEPDLSKILTKIVKDIRENIILKSLDKQKDKIRIAIQNYDNDFFDGEIQFKKKKYNYKDLYVGQKINSENILIDISKFIDFKNYHIDFVSTSDMEKVKNTYVKTFVTKISLSNDINKLIDFASLNLFIKIYFLMLNNRDYPDKSFFLDDIYNPKKKPNSDKKLDKKSEWNKFYAKLISRRVLMLWTVLFNDFDENIKNYHIDDKKVNIYKLITMFLFHGKSKPVKTTKTYQKDLINRDLGFKKSHLENFNSKNSFAGELNFINTYKFEVISNIIQAITQINSDRVKKYRNHYENLSNDLWGIKTSYLDVFDDEEINNLFNKDVKSEIEELKLEKEIEEIFFNENIKDINDLFSSITSITKKIQQPNI